MLLHITVINIIINISNVLDCGPSAGEIPDATAATDEGIYEILIIVIITHYCDQYCITINILNVCSQSC